MHAGSESRWQGGSGVQGPVEPVEPDVIALTEELTRRIDRLIEAVLRRDVVSAREARAALRTGMLDAVERYVGEREAEVMG